MFITPSFKKSLIVVPGNYLKHSLLTSYKRKQFYSIQSGQSATLQQLIFISKYVWVIDQVWGQDGWILAKFFFACLWTETKSRSINTQKRTWPISSHLDRTNLVNKGFIIWLLEKFCSRDTAGSPERARWLHLARSGSQSQRAIWFILPARGAGHIIK